MLSKPCWNPKDNKQTHNCGVMLGSCQGNLVYIGQVWPIWVIWQIMLDSKKAQIWPQETFLQYNHSLIGVSFVCFQTTLFYKRANAIHVVLFVSSCLLLFKLFCLWSTHLLLAFFVIVTSIHPTSSPTNHLDFWPRTLSPPFASKHALACGW